MSKKEIKGIGGWLLILIIGFFFSAIFSFFIELLIIYLIYLKFSFFRIVCFILITLILLLEIWTINVGFKKKKTFPKIAIITLWVTFLIGGGFSLYYYNAIDSFEAIGKIIDILLSLALSILWTLYLIKSKRVKNTFIN